jgi:hypothetical protein
MKIAAWENVPAAIEKVRLGSPAFPLRTLGRPPLGDNMQEGFDQKNS